MKCTDNYIITVLCRIALFLTGLFVGTGAYGIANRIEPREAYFILIQVGIMFFICSLISCVLWFLEWLEGAGNPSDPSPYKLREVKVSSPLSSV
jgi:hypothetical protein